MAKKISLVDAVFAGDEKAVEQRLSKSAAEIHYQDEMGFTPLHWAADRGHGQIARLLLEAGASPDVQDMDGLTPLHYACIKGSLDCASVMIPLADLDITDFKREKNALEHARGAVKSAAGGFDVERGEPAQKIIELLINEPGRREALAQASILEKASKAGEPSPSKPRI